MREFSLVGARAKAVPYGAQKHAASLLLDISMTAVVLAMTMVFVGTLAKSML
jgi:hypothetical protein